MIEQLQTIPLTGNFSGSVRQGCLRSGLAAARYAAQKRYIDDKQKKAE